MTNSPEKPENRRQREEEILQNLTLLDDTFMAVCFSQFTDALQHVLQIILDKPDLKVVKAERKKPFMDLDDGSLCVQAWAVEPSGHRYLIGVQTDTHGASPRRARLSLSSMVHETLSEDEFADENLDTWMIFLTSKDVFETGLPVNHLGLRVRETGEILDLGYGTIYFNASYRGDDSYGRLAHDLCCPDPDQMYCAALAAPVRYFKTTEKGKQEMLSVLKEQSEEERQEAILASQLKVAASLLRRGTMTLEEIEDITNLPGERLLELQEELPEQF